MRRASEKIWRGTVFIVAWANVHHLDGQVWKCDLAWAMKSDMPNFRGKVNADHPLKHTKRYENTVKLGKGPFNNYVNKMRGGRGSKNVCFCLRSGYKTVHSVRRGQKMAKFCPRSCWMTPNENSCLMSLRQAYISIHTGEYSSIHVMFKLRLKKMFSLSISNC